MFWTTRNLILIAFSFQTTHKVLPNAFQFIPFQDFFNNSVSKQSSVAFCFCFVFVFLTMKLQTWFLLYIKMNLST